jgi:NAD(P)-dependent dehydrogenase (short-subunit alcohol dehydrogenase family)
VARLDGRTAVVSGGGRGLGAAVARVLATEGADVAVLARSASDVDAVAGVTGGRGLTVDVSDADALAAALAELDPVDVVVANAGVVWPLGKFADIDLDEWERAVAINLFGAVRLVKATLPAMLERGWGRIVTVSSGAARAPGMPSANAYSTSKAALDLFTLHLAAELEGTGVTANAVRPGVVDTPMQEFMRAQPVEQVGAAFHERFHGLHERGELVGADEAAAFLVDQLLSGRNGEVVDIRDR